MVVEADANQLQQALVNLALNARDAILLRRESCGPAKGQGPGAGPPSDKVVLRLKQVVLGEQQSAFPQTVPAGDYLLVQVTDEGVGMASEVLGQALDPFFTTKEVGQGTGLGLPMVFGIVQGHQGYLTIDTAAGQGTSVGLYLPRLIETGVQPPTAAPSSPQGGGKMDEVVEAENQPGRSILVIDDEEPVLDIVRRFLEIAGHQVHAVTSGQQGVEHLAAGRRVDLVILDLMMPREDAQVTFQRLRQKAPNVPVLLCTGLADAHPAAGLLTQPATGLLRKPFRMNELWYAVRQTLAAV
jgi:two-component system cell cycle sensor histidine kinase/response regulator CckA